MKKNFLEFEKFMEIIIKASEDEIIDFSETEFLLRYYHKMDKENASLNTIRIIQKTIIDTILKKTPEKFKSELKKEMNFFIISDILLLRSLIIHEFETFDDIMLFNDLEIDKFLDWIIKHNNFKEVDADEIKKFLPIEFYFVKDNWVFVIDFDKIWLKHDLNKSGFDIKKFLSNS